MKLTKSQAHYIKAVYELSFSCDDGVQVCDVAEKFNVSKASACIALMKLSEQGFLYKDSERRAHLTKSGESKAIQLLDKFEVIKTFLVKILRVEESITDQDACAIEHVISTDTLCAVCRFSKRVGCTDACSLSHTIDT